MMFQVELVCQSSTTPIAGNCAMFSLKTDWVLKLPFPLNHCLTLWNSPTFLSAPALKLGEASKCRGFSKAAAAASSAWMPRCATTILEFPKRQTVKSRKATGFKPLASNITVNPRSTVWNQCFHSSCYIQIIIYICICMYIYNHQKHCSLRGLYRIPTTCCAPRQNRRLNLLYLSFSVRPFSFSRQGRGQDMLEVSLKW